MAFRGKCEICGCTSFNIEDGYYYCTECNTQNHTVMEMEVNAMDLKMGDEKVKVQGVKLKAEKEAKVELTSWEEYNYILLGLVNEAIALGAPCQLKKVVFQLWSRYLQKINAAFFSKSDTALPKLPTNFYKKDACLLYNVRRKRRRSTSSVSTKSSRSSKPPETKKALTMARSRLKSALMQEQLALSSQTSQATDSSTSNTNTSKTAATMIPLEFTSLARKALKRRMPKSHIKKHANDPERILTCHSKTPVRHTLDERLEKVSKNVLLSLLYIGLNLTGSEIQLGDILRFAREGHISIFRVDHFFPPNILKHIKRSSYINFQAKYIFPTHSFLRTVTGKLCIQLGVKYLKKPDFVSLVQRYVRELCLPEEMGKYLRRLINFRPPEMNSTGSCPNYEARAIAYVIFMLKWLFGLDDTSEEVMSEAAGQVNRELKNVRTPMQDVFDFVEWMKYIEMRSVVLSEYHMSTSIATRIEGDAANTQKYLEYLNFCKRPGLTTKRSIANGIYNIFEKLSLLHNENDRKDGSKSFNFAPSMTPFKTYFEFLLNHHGEDLEIPEFMQIDHSKRTIDPFLRPNRFRNQLIKCQINILLKECPESSEMVTVKRTRQRSKTEDLLAYVQIVSNDEDCTYQDYFEKKPKKVTKKSNSRASGKKKTEKTSSGLSKARKEVSEEATQPSLSSEVLLEDNMDPGEYILDEPRRDLEKMSMFDEMSDPDDVECPDPGEISQELEFFIPHYQYWHNFISYKSGTWNIREETFQELLDKLPNSFIWLLRQCSVITGIDQRTIYIELLTIEKQFTYILESPDLMTNMVLLRDKSSKMSVDNGGSIFFNFW